MPWKRPLPAPHGNARTRRTYRNQRAERGAQRPKQGDDLQALRAGTEALDKATHRFAELMMDAAVTTAIKGQNHCNPAGDNLGKGPTAPHPIAQAEFIERK